MTIVYLLVTRAAAPGRHYSVPVLATFFGAAGGWATLASGGLAAAFIGHAVTSFGLFVFTGHAGQMPRGDREPEELAVWTEPPKGWIDARLVRGAPGGNVPAAATETYHEIGPSGFRSRADRWSAGRSTGLLAWIASAGLAVTGRKSGDRRATDHRPAPRRQAANAPDGGPRPRGRRPAKGSAGGRRPAKG
jgi:hypothetical protein